VTKYQKRISGPLLDRIDIDVEVPRVDCQKLSDDRLGETSETIRNRVERAREVPGKRFGVNREPRTVNKEAAHESRITIREALI
jgi:magnesium chelatase family protein